MTRYRDALARCEELAAKQLGLISLEQCFECGLNRRAVSRVVTRGDWKRVLPTVFMPRPVPTSWWTSAKAATLWGGPSCVLCGPAAARARELPGFGAAEVEIACPTDRRIDLLTVHHYPALPLSPPTEIRTVPLIPVESMAFELCRSQSYRRARRAVSEIVRREWTSDAVLKARLLQIGGKGLEGTRWMRAILEERAGMELSAETDAEIEFARLAALWGLDPVPQYRLRVDGRIVRRFDFAFPSYRVGVEIDGGIHLDPTIRADDEEKDRVARAVGWRVLRFTDHEVWIGSMAMRKYLLQVLESQGWKPSPLLLDR